MLEEFDGLTTMPKVMPHKVPAWIQLHKVPLLYRSESILKRLAGRVGGPITVEMRAAVLNRGDFFRARVELEAGRPLVRFVTLTPEGCESLLIPVKYEKIARFCAHCGLMGHDHLECGSGEFLEEELQFWDWMKAGEELWRPGTPRVRNTPMLIVRYPGEGTRGRLSVVDAQLDGTLGAVLGSLMSMLAEAHSGRRRRQPARIHARETPKKLGWEPRERMSWGILQLVRPSPPRNLLKQGKRSQKRRRNLYWTWLPRRN
jgi:hypothetical protein